MKTAFQHSALLSIVALAMVPMSAFADDKLSALYETTLDIDNDGKTDRAVLVLVGSDRTDVGPLTDELYAIGDGESVDLYLYLAVGEGKLDLSHKPAVLKKKIVDPEQTPRVQPLESKDSGSLVVASCYGCGANKSWDQTLTIVYRGGEFLVAGYTRDSRGRERRDGHGRLRHRLPRGKRRRVGRAGRGQADRREIHAREAHALVG